MEQAIAVQSNPSWVAETWKEVHPTAKTLIVLVVAAGASYGIYELVKYLQKLSAQAAYKKTEQEVKNELKDVLKTQKPNYPDSTYKTWATTIASLLNGCDFHSNDTKVANILLQIKNNADWLKLVQAFGTKTIESCGIGDDYEANLPTILSRELGDSTIKAANVLFTKRGIDSRL